MPIDLINFWNDLYNGLKTIQPVLIPLTVLISVIVLFFGNNLLGIISVKFCSYSEGVIYRHQNFKKNPTWFTFILPIEITTNSETEIIGAELRYKNKRAKDKTLPLTVSGQIDPWSTHNFSIALRKNIAAKQNLIFLFGGNLAEECYKDIEEFTVNNGSFGIDCYLRLSYRKNNKVKYTGFKKFRFGPITNRVWIHGLGVKLINDDNEILENV